MSAAPRGLTAREGAVSLIAGVLDRGRMLGEPGLAGDAAERAEARALADTALRRLDQIDAALAARLDRMPKPPVLHVLRVMAAELLFSDRAAHAAVDMAVRQVKRGRTARMAGLVNAVGRRLAAEGAGAAPQADTMPRWLRARLEADWGASATRAMADAHLAPPPVDLTPRDPRAGAHLSEALGARVLPGGTLRLPGRPQISALPGFADGLFWAQDAAAALPVRLLGDVAGRRVLDLCAAPGGKTLQLAAAGARVTALDVSAARIARLEENLARTGLAAEIVVADALAWTPPAAFDAVLIDAPCSATGTLRRHPDLARRRAPDLAALTARQARLLDRARDWLAPGGVLGYAVCSLFRAEGEDQADAFARRHPRMRVLAPRDPAIAPVLDMQGRLRTLPDMMAGHGGMDGFFAAAFAAPG